jgi:hypothetical protein
MHHEWYPKAHGYLGPWGAVCFGFRHSSWLDFESIPGHW